MARRPFLQIQCKFLLNTFSMKQMIFFILLLMSVLSKEALSQGFTIKTKGDFPYLVYSSSASDRLGGAKMTYLDTAILMKANRISNGNYAVQLSKNHEAFIPTDYADVVNTTLSQEYLGGSLKAYGDSAYDYVTFNTNGVKLPYRSVMQVYPSKLIVDVFGIGNNTNWIMHNHDLLKMVKQVSTEQVEDDVYRIIIDLKHEQNWGYRISYDTANYNYLTIRLKHPPKTKTLKNLKVAIDAGHGGSNVGARGVSGRVTEKEYNLIIAQLLAEKLRSQGAKVFMTRTTDKTLSMDDRLKMLQEYQPDIMLSIHLNAAARDTVRGVSTYYRYPGFKNLSLNILNRMAELDIDNWGNVGNFNFTLNAPTEYPNALIEVAFVSNPEDEKRILNAEFRKKAVDKIRIGIEDFLKDAIKH